jgi:diguanylate cyclase (GGDEF)-like protein
MPRHIAYPAIGASAAFAVAAGLLLIRLSPAEIGWATVRGEVLADIATYLYLVIVAMTVFVGLGAALGYQTDRLLTLAVTDPLTGLHNRRALQFRMDEEISRAARCAQQLSILLIDLDKFKQVNDRCGHLAGDALLCGIGQAIQSTLRKTDHGARIGGDEFVIVAPNTGRMAASLLARRVRLAIAGEARRQHLPVTASIGISTYDPEGSQPIDRIALMYAADTALYDAKHGGGNSTTIAPQPIEGQPRDADCDLDAALTAL